MTPDIRKCAIVGCGNVGMTTAFSLMKSGLFSEMVLIDIDKRRVHGEAADLGHGLPFLAPMDIYAGDWRDTAGAGIIIIAAGVAQKPGETRKHAYFCRHLRGNLQVQHRGHFVGSDEPR